LSLLQLPLHHFAASSDVQCLAVQAELRANVFLAINDQDIAQGGVGKLDILEESNPWPLDPSTAELLGLALSLTLHLLLLLQGLAAKAMQHTGWCWLQTPQVIECRPLSAGRPLPLLPHLTLGTDLAPTGVLLLELVREVMQWSNLQFTQQVRRWQRELLPAVACPICCQQHSQ